ncbi:putative Polycomb group protein ASXL2 isoform X3 [Acipenser ruthenus]|uniref:putative Polycomb group protein ASXL2 isoform X3 n=1 Tax=Acipenser ruthenus TaxID=7906 RepID=UPI00274193CE|nr:putative Polycomb group protein ASXL2 isoform X3 [Acipenser ruthenus]XP_058879707.1 putative Polycomb group protein ASXL2 isoform X3 [Acipenser ruthenus]
MFKCNATHQLSRGRGHFLQSTRSYGSLHIEDTTRRPVCNVVLSTHAKDISDSAKNLSEEGSEDSSDNLSDSQSTENNNNSNKDMKKSKWKRKVPSKLQSQPPSPQSRCQSPSITANKVISPSQKHCKKALKQALKQQQQKNQRRQGAVPASSNPRLLLKTVKDMGDQTASKTGWKVKQSDRRSSSPQNSTSSSSSSMKTDQSSSAACKKTSQRSDRLNARQLKRSKCAEIDVETPDSILVNTNLRALINKHTFCVLPPECQQRLLILLPEVDRQVSADGLMKLSSSALNNEFFTSAAQSWKERLSEGEFTPEMRLRIRQEIEKEKKVELWKEDFFESYYGQHSGLSLEESKMLTVATKEPEAIIQQPIPLAPRQTPAMKTEVEAELKEELKAKIDKKSASEIKKEDKKACGTLEILKTHPRNKTLKTERSQARASPEKTPESPVVEKPFVDVAKVVSAAVNVKTEDKAKEKEFLTRESQEQGGCKLKVSPQTTKIPSHDKMEVTMTPVDKQEGDRSRKMQEAEQMEVTQAGLKRKSPSQQEEVLSSPEKRPRVSEQQLFRTPPKSPHDSRENTPEPKVPPLKIPVSRILPVAAPAGQVSPRAPFTSPITSPGRTGARTLADIKAKAQLARAQRAATAAAAAAAATVSSLGGSVPGPGPGGGGGPSGASGTGDAVSEPGTAELGRARGRGAAGGILPASPEAHAKSLSFNGCDSRTQLQQTATSEARACYTSTASNSLSAGSPPATTSLIGNSSTENTASPLSTSSQSSKSGGASSFTFKEQSKSAASALDVTQPPTQSSTVPVNDDSETDIDKTGKAIITEKGIDLSKETYASPLVQQPSASVVSTVKPPDTVLASSMPTVSPHSSIAVTLETSSSILSTASSQKMPVTHPADGPVTKTSSSIPANNPLVTQLLQGKEVPLEQILPKTLTRNEVKPLIVASGDKGKVSNTTTVVVSVANPVLYGKAVNSQRHLWPSQVMMEKVDLAQQQREMLNKTTQQQILQTLIERAQGQHFIPVSHPSQQGFCHFDLPIEENSSSQRFTLGFMGRKRTSKPAMSGHYLLNISTYGRGSESYKRAQLANTENRLGMNVPFSVLKKEFKEGDMTAGENEEQHAFERSDDLAAGRSELSAVKKEQQGPLDVERIRVSPSNMQPDALLDVSYNHRVKLESALIDQLPDREEGSALSASNNAVAIAKEIDQVSKSSIAHSEAGNHPLGNSELYQMPVSAGNHQRQESICHQRKLYENHSSEVGHFYGGKINVSASHALNHSSKAPGNSPGYSPVSSSAGSVMSFSVTVTTIPASRTLDHVSHGERTPMQAFTEGVGIEDSPSDCYCRLKAMIMCKGCGAFCHDDCIGPSKLCVSCLVVR